MDVIRLQRLFCRLDDEVDIILPLLAPHGHARANILIGLGFQNRKGKVLKLRLHPSDSKTIRQRRVDLKGLLGDSSLFG